MITLQVTINCSNIFYHQTIILFAVPVAPTDVVVLTMYDTDSLFLSRVDLQWSIPVSKLLFYYSVCVKILA